MSQGGVYSEANGPAEGAVTLVKADNAVSVPPNPITGAVNIYGGPGISTFGNAGSYTLTINSTATGFAWNAISTDQSLANKNGYICVGGANLLLSLPTTSIVGDILAILLDGSTGFTITQGPGQQIRLGDSLTTLGVGGSISSLFQGDAVVLVCKTPNLAWTCYGSMGNITIS